ncbi:MAG: type VI secretion system lipoprotein TssJ [Gammaproteobacteria bacterium]|nr:type VI secretion system lipoprotein TssJ [Gammaproteobacteria bacterium]
MKMVIRKSHFLAFIAISLVITACKSGPKPPPPTKLKGNIVAAAAINPDPAGRPSPVVMRIYHLKSNTVFESADFFSLYNDAAGTLAEDLVATEEFMIRPGVEQPYEAEFDGEVRYIGVMAAYRDIGKAQWRDVMPLPEDGLLDFLRRKKLAIALEDVAINVTFE